MKAYVLAALLLFSSSSAVADGDANFVPFHTDTYIAFTKSYFLATYKGACQIKKGGAISDLIGNSIMTEKIIDENRIRGYVREDGNLIFVDTDGVFNFNKFNYSITERNFKNVISRHFSCVDAESKDRRAH